MVYLVVTLEKSKCFIREQHLNEKIWLSRRHAKGIRSESLRKMRSNSQENQTDELGGHLKYCNLTHKLRFEIKNRNI